MGSSSSKRKVVTASEIETSPAEEALRNDLILENISTFLSVSDLLNFRQVNWKWNQTSLNAIRRKSLLDLSNLREHIQRHFQSKRNWSELKTKEYVDHLNSRKLQKRKIKLCKSLTQLIRNSAVGFPCSNIRAKWEPNIIKQKLFDDFVLAIASFVTELDIQADNFCALTLPTNIKFPNLRAIKMEHFRNSTSNNILECFKQIIKSAPELKTLILISSNAKSLVKFLETMEIQQARKIGTLWLNASIWDEHFSALSRIGFQLKSFKLSLGTASVFYSESLTSFLQSQSHSLESLTIECHGFVSPITVKFPCMQNLKQLQLIVEQCKFPELDYHKKFPNLTHLLLDYDVHLEQFLNLSMEQLQTVHTLEFGNELEEPEMIIRAAGLFPNVVKLKVRTTRVLLRTVGNTMENLKELTLIVMEEDVSELFEVLTGYSKSEMHCDNCRRENKEPFPFLHNLTLLRILNFGITDALCEFGPLKLASLKCLDLSRSRDFQISERVLAEMRRKFLVLMPYG